MFNTVSFSKWEPRGGRGQLIVSFREPPPAYVLRALCNVLDSQGYEIQGNGRCFKFWTSNSHVSDTKVALAKQALHRVGFQRHDEVWDDQETADGLFGESIVATQR